MIPWEYDGTKYSKDDYILAPEGEHSVVIKEAHERLTKNGKNMVELILNVVNMPQYGKLFYYLVINNDYPDMTNQRLGRIYDSFDITPGSMDTYSWIGCIGVARVKHEEDDKGKMRARVDSFAPREEEEPKAKPKQAKASQAGTKKKPAKVVEEGWDFKDNGPEFPELDPEMIKAIEEESDVPF